MTQADFDHWHGILRAHFPEHPYTRRRDFVPRLPADAVRELEKLGGFDQAIRSAIDGIKTRFWLD
ncbi:MAG TPA: hypothetical protein VD833_00050 [Vicinamibacterales bacterium]|nr:hypothetical protein [Vicinamibacterales bacterium]